MERILEIFFRPVSLLFVTNPTIFRFQLKQYLLLKVFQLNRILIQVNVSHYHLVKLFFFLISTQKYNQLTICQLRHYKIKIHKVIQVIDTILLQHILLTVLSFFHQLLFEPTQNHIFLHHSYCLQEYFLVSKIAEKNSKKGIPNLDVRFLHCEDI